MRELKITTLSEIRSIEDIKVVDKMTVKDIESLNGLHRYLLEIMINEEVQIGNNKVKCSDIKEVDIIFE